MLDIPDAIKALYKTDGVWKNFRAVRPSGVAITNQNIVRESLKFTESACSDNVFQFGGCERSMIEFETVGVSNMRGESLVCSIEISTDRLTAAQRTAVAADPGDGELISAADSGIGREIYRIPLGRFIVAKCPRDHQAMTHRQVTAYSPRYWQLSPIEEAKQDWYSGNLAMQIDPRRFMLANVGYWSPAFMEAQGCTKAQVIAWSDFSTGTINSSGSYKTGEGEWWTWRVTGQYRTIGFGIGSIEDMFDIHIGDLDVAGLEEFVTTWMGDMDWEDTDMSYGSVAIRSVHDFMRYILGVTAHAVPCLQNFDWAPFSYQVAVLTEDAPVFDAVAVRPDFSGATSIPNAKSQGWWDLYIPSSVTLELLDEDSQVRLSFSTAVNTDLPAVYKWTLPSDTDATVTLTPPVTDTMTYYGSDEENVTYRRWLGLDTEKIIKGWMEINGSLLISGRGTPKVIQLDLSDSEAISPGEYAGVWWGETKAALISSVGFLFGENHDQAGVFRLSGGGSYYDMSANGLLSVVYGKTTAAQISAMIDARMRLGLLNLSRYVAAEVSMPAWPWLEPGDALEVETEDQETVETYVMERTITGVQLLFDEISATGGDEEDDV